MSTGFEEMIAAFAADDSDAYAYAGPIEKYGYERICETIRKDRRKKAVLFLCTSGGDPNAGYRIARAFIHCYGVENFRVAVPTDCKSAGTLVCIGAHSLVMFDRGELGPLDIQIQKQDEIFQQSSGLDILRGMTYLQTEALKSFKQYWFDINAGSGISTRVASEIASSLVKGLYTPVFGQIDPVKLGEMNAALQIAHEYGTRLNDKSKNLKEDALRKLINNYPAHGFVIDRAEARELFHRVEPPTPAERTAGEFVRTVWESVRRARPSVVDLLDIFGAYDEKTDADTPGAGDEQGAAHPDDPDQRGQAPGADGAAAGQPARDDAEPEPPI